jgi:hypothetical protein
MDTESVSQRLGARTTKTDGKDVKRKQFTMSGSFSIMQKVFNSRNKEITIGSRIVSFLRGHNRKYANLYAFIGGLAICLCCFVKPTLAVPGNERPESLNSGQVLTPKSVNDLTARNIVLREIKPSLCESLIKLFRRLNTFGAAGAPKAESVSGKDAKKANDSSYKCDDYCGFYAWPPMLIALLYGVWLAHRKAGDCK